MKSITLNQTLRNRIVFRAMKGVMENEMILARNKIKEVALEAFESTIPKDKLELLKKLGPEYALSLDEIVFMSPSRRHSIRVNVGSVLAPASMMYDRSVCLDERHYEALSKADGERQAIVVKIQEIESKVRSVVLSAKTVKQLIAIWPEVVEFIPKEVTNSGVSYPLAVTDIPSLNGMLAKSKKLEEAKAASSSEDGTYSAQVVAAINEEVTQ